MKLTLLQLEGKIREYTKVIQAPEELIPTFGSSKQTGLAHIEINGGQYSLIVCEKGAELTRETFDDPDELLFKVLHDISFSMASDRVFEYTNFLSFKERFFQAQKNIISKINRYSNDSKTLKQDVLTTQDTKALNESRIKTLLKSKLNKTPLKKKLSSR